MKVVRTFGLALLFCSMAAMLGAQGVQTGTIRGSGQGPAGSRRSRRDRHRDVAGAAGAARRHVRCARAASCSPTLPPGAYEVKFELSGFATVNQNTNVPLGRTIEQNVTMRTAGVDRDGAGRRRDRRRRSPRRSSA